MCACLAQDALSAYKTLQGEFRETHKVFDKAKVGGGSGLSGPTPTPSELRKEITQLEDERTQLVEKIAGLKKKTSEIVSASLHLRRTHVAVPAKHQELLTV